MDVNEPQAATRRPSLREERAGLTRARILDAARLLFARDGFVATTLKAVAAEAGVAVQTVYAVFGSKAAILTELRWMVVDQPEADAARRAAMVAPTATERVDHFAHSLRVRWENVGDIVRIDQDAARSDASIREQTRPAEARRQAGIATFAWSLVGDLDLLLDATAAAAEIDALTMYQGYSQLVDVHGWTPDQYEAWLRRHLRQALGQPLPSD